MSFISFREPGLRTSVLALVWCVIAWPRGASAQDAFGAAHYEEPRPRPDLLRGDPTDWDPALPVPVGYHVERRTRYNLVVRGGGVLFVLYFSSVIGALASPREAGHEAALWIPIAGPYIQLAQTSSSNSMGTIVLATDAAFQTLAAGVILYGLIVPARVLVRDVWSVRISLAPLSLGARGLGIAGTF